MTLKNKCIIESEEKIQWLNTIAVFPEDPGLALSTHMAAHIVHNSSSKGLTASHRRTCRQNTVHVKKRERGTDCVKMIERM